MPWLLLTLAITSEVVGTLALKASEGFTRLLPSVFVVLGYLTSFALLGVALRTLPVSVSYAIWSAAGTAIVAIGGVVLFGEHMSWLMAAGLAVIIAGVVIVTVAEGRA